MYVVRVSLKNTQGLTYPMKHSSKANVRFCCLGCGVNKNNLPCMFLFHLCMSQSPKINSSCWKQFLQIHILNCLATVVSIKLRWDVAKFSELPTSESLCTNSLWHFVFFGERRTTLPSLHSVIHHILAYWRSILP